MVAPVDEHDVDVRPPEAADGGEAAKPAPDDHDARSARCPLHGHVLVLVQWSLLSCACVVAAPPRAVPHEAQRCQLAGAAATAATGDGRGTTGARRSPRPARRPVGSPASSAMTPLTITVLMPAGYWRGSSNVARSPMVAGSKTTTSAKAPGRSSPLSTSRICRAAADVILCTASGS